jgi:hypothetical protein
MLSKRRSRDNLGTFIVSGSLAEKIGRDHLGALPHYWVDVSKQQISAETSTPGTCGKVHI